MYYLKRIQTGKIVEVMRCTEKFVSPTKKNSGSSIIDEDMIRKVNARNAEVKLRRILNSNFYENGLHVVLTYRQDDRPEPHRAKAELKKFIRKVRREFQKANIQLKYVYVTEYKNRAIHHHIVINSIPGISMQEKIEHLWGRGNIHCTKLHPSGQYRKLAAYLIKETEETFRESDGGQRKRFQTSKGLDKPVVETQPVMGNDWPADPEIESGYKLDVDTLYNGIHPFTKTKIQKYALIETDAANRKENALDR